MYMRACVVSVYEYSMQKFYHVCVYMLYCYAT